MPRIPARPRSRPPSRLRRDGRAPTLPALLALLPALLLAACATPGDSASHATLTDAQPLARQLSQGKAPWPQDRWWAALGDAQLDRLIDMALADSPSLHVAEARLAKARALADSADARRFADVSLNAQASRQRYTANGMIPPPVAGTVRESGQLTLDFAYDFDFWGRNRQYIAAAVSQTRAAEAERESARQVLIAAVVDAWSQLDRSYRLLDIADAQVKQRERQQALIQQLLAAGLSPRGEANSARSTAASARQERLALREQLALQRHQLAALLGRGPDFAATLPRPQLQAQADDGVPTVLPADLLGRRPDLVAARWRVEAARGNVGAARAEFYPNVNLTAFTGYSSIGLGQLLKSGSGIAGIGPALNLPLFDGGRRRANLGGANADLDLAIEQYNQSLLDAVRDVADQVASLNALAAQAQEARLALVQAGSARTLAQTRFTAGLASELTTLASDDVWLARQRTLTDIDTRRLTSRIALIKALGGGYDAAPQTHTQEGAPVSAAQ
ncbi:efflux transporter outer membrane subunit [Rhodocyclus tenuis]|uniref:Efflux transporter outer membrane subunit n=1 Tax=Rhodocyclus tenuis TaxID=1066 RepID=A0A6L5JZM3_RHOTE|nr:efflux transporter outer membrane subunit [Rhodocyclus gracilis]